MARVGVAMRRAAWGVVILVGLGSVIVAGQTIYGLLNLPTSDPPDDAPTPGMIEGRGGIHIPASARDLRGRTHIVWTKTYLYARFTVPAADLPAVMEGGEFAKPTPTPASRLPLAGVASDAPDWWTPERGRSLLATKGHLSTLIIDASDPKELVIYCFSLC